MPTMTDFPAFAHVALTVTDLSVSVAWYRALIGADPVVDEDDGSLHHTVFLIGEGTPLALHQHFDPGDVLYREQNPGLDHVGFACATRADLEEWQSRLDELGISHGGIVDKPYGSGLSFRDPDNIALEFFAPPGT
jgi:catechol-2,3-dioxygenase